MLKTEKERINESLFRFLESIYFFEKHEEQTYGLNWNEVYLLQILSRKPGLCVTDLANMMKEKPFVISRMLSKMEAAGFVRKTNGDNDKRFFYQYVTEAGASLIEEIEEFNSSVVVSQLKSMTKEHSEFILSILDNLGDLLRLPTGDR